MTCIDILCGLPVSIQSPLKDILSKPSTQSPGCLKAQRSGVMVEIYSKSNVRNIQLLKMLTFICCLCGVMSLWMHSVGHFTRLTEATKFANMHKYTCKHVFLNCFVDCCPLKSRLGVWQEGWWCHERAFLAVNLERGQSQSQSEGVNNWLLAGIWA